MTDFEILSTNDALNAGLVTPRAGLRYTLEVVRRTNANAHDGMVNVGLVFAREVIQQAAIQMNGALANEMEIFSEAMSSSMARNRDGRVTRIHTIAGQEAVKSTVRSYERRRRKVRKAADRAAPGSSFAARQPAFLRRSRRYANGVLGKALASNQMYDARWDGVSFINSTFLDRTARQWYRLNFGAGDRGRSTPRPGDYPIKFFGESVYSMTLKPFGPSGSFVLPAGAWFGFDGGGSSLPTPSIASGPRRTLGNKASRAGAPDPSRRGLDQFIPGGFNNLAYPRRRTQGIQGSPFLDAGVKALTHHLGRGWSVLMNEWFEEAAVQRTGPISVLLNPDAAAVASQKISQELRDMNVDLTRYKSVMGRL